MPHIVDTVALVRHMEDSPLLGSHAARILKDPQAHLIFPAIVLAETQYLLAKKRSPLSFPQILQAIGSDPRCVVFPINLEVILASPPPPRLEMHDGLVYGTAVVVAAQMGLAIADVPILTSDRMLRACGAPVLW